MEKLSIEELFCPYCGVQLRLEGSFCADCGTNFEEMDGEVATVVHQREIQKIMGKNFFGIKEAMKHFKANPADQDLNALAKPFSKPALKELKNTHILTAVFPLSILDIRKMNAKLLIYHSWYLDETFAKEHGKVSWQLVRKTPVPNSTSKKWSKQQKLLAKDDEVPTAQVMVYTIIGYYLATGERLFKNIYVRTSSIDSDGSRVSVGNFGLSGLYISHYNDDGDDRGVSSARKFPK